MKYGRLWGLNSDFLTMHKLLRHAGSDALKRGLVEISFTLRLAKRAEKMVPEYVVCQIRKQIPRPST